MESIHFMVYQKVVQVSILEGEKEAGKPFVESVLCN